MNNINIELENRNYKGFFIQRGFITLSDENGDIIAISSGWESYGCLMVYRFLTTEQKWNRKWEDKDTFPVKESLEIQKEFKRKETETVSMAEIIQQLETISELDDKIAIKEIAKKVNKLKLFIEHTKSWLHDIPFKYEITNEVKVWEHALKRKEKNYYETDEDVYRNLIRKSMTSNGVQWCAYYYGYEGYYSRECDERVIIVLIYIPVKYGTEDKELLKTIHEYNL